MSEFVMTLTAKASYGYEVVHGVVCIVDQNQGCSVTNDAEAVIADLGKAGVDLANQPVIYRDSEGQWDELLVINGQFSAFRFLHTRDRAKAMNRATLRAVALRANHPDAASILDSITYRGAHARFDGALLVMEGPTGRHSLFRNASTIERMAAHWNSFCYATDQHHQQASSTQMAGMALELARAYLTTYAEREASYDPVSRVYRLRLSEAAASAGVALPIREPVTALVNANASATQLWAMRLVRKN